MKIHFNWQIIRRPIKDAMSGGGARDENHEHRQKRAASELVFNYANGVGRTAKAP